MIFNVSLCFYTIVTFFIFRKKGNLEKTVNEYLKLIEKWLEEQENPLDLYKPLPFDTIKQALQEWLNPEDEEEVEETVEEVKEEPKSNYSLSSKPAAKKSKDRTNNSDKYQNKQQDNKAQH